MRIAAVLFALLGLAGCCAPAGNAFASLYLNQCGAPGRLSSGRKVGRVAAVACGLHVVRDRKLRQAPATTAEGCVP